MSTQTTKSICSSTYSNLRLRSLVWILLHLKLKRLKKADLYNTLLHSKWWLTMHVHVPSRVLLAQIHRMMVVAVYCVGASAGGCAAVATRARPVPSSTN